MKAYKTKINIANNHLRNILRLSYIWPIFHFTTNETMLHYYLSIWYVRVASRVAGRLKISDLSKV